MSDTVSPRIRHNSGLCALWIAENQVTCRYSRVIDQVPCLPLEHSKLFPFAYNPSLLNVNGEYVMAYRYHDGNTLHSDLAVARLHLDGSVKSNQRINLGAGGEDAKLFWAKDEVGISWVESSYPQKPWTSIVRMGVLVGNEIKKDLTLALPGNDGKTVQKNWVFFEHAGTLHVIYRTSPDQIIYAIGQDIVHKMPGPKWAYGEPRGGTPPIRFGDHYLRFFHSGLDNEFGPYPRRYFLGAYLMECQPPFKVVAVSSKPIVYGSEIDRLKKAQWEVCPQYKRQVVFPGGAVSSHVSNDGYVVAVGVNDSSCELLLIKDDDLHLA